MDDTQNEGLEMVSFGIVAAAGEARSLAFEALAAARAGDFERAQDCLARSEQAGLEAHSKQTELLSRQADGEDIPVDMLLVHAQDHLMTAMLARELIAEMVNLYQVKQDKDA